MRTCDVTSQCHITNYHHLEPHHNTMTDEGGEGAPEGKTTRVGGGPSCSSPKHGSYLNFNYIIFTNMSFSTMKMWRAGEGPCLSPCNCKGYCGQADAERGAEQNTVLAGDPKVFRLLCNTNLNMIHT